MGWAFCGEDRYGREIGYGIEATCDRRGCDELINRGLGCVCGTDDLEDQRPMHGASAGGCGRYYCDAHGGGWSVGPRGGCPHRGKKPWGRTKCQLLSNDRKHQTAYFCACHEWSYEGKALPKFDRRKVAEDPFLVNPALVPGFMEHVKARGFASEMGKGEPEAPLSAADEAQSAAFLARIPLHGTG